MGDLDKSYLVPGWVESYSIWVRRGSLQCLVVDGQLPAAVM